MRIDKKKIIFAIVSCIIVIIVFIALKYGESFSNIYKFTPNKDYSGNATIKFEVSDSINSPIPASIDFNILPVNDDPVFQPLALEMDEDIPSVFSSSDFLGSFINPDDDKLEVENVRYDITGQPIPVQDNKWTITSAPDFNGPLKIFYDIISYNKTNNTVKNKYQKDTTIKVKPTNDTPVVGSLDPISANSNTNTVFDLLKGVSDVDNDTLTVSDVFVYKDENESQGSVITPVNGVYSYTFPTGGKYTIKYNISDGTVTIPRVQIVNVNNSPILPTNLNLTGPQNLKTTFTVSDLLGNATDPDGDILTVDDVRYIDETGTPLTKNTDGTYIFTSAPNSSAPVTIFYKIGDGKIFTPFKTVVTVLNNPPYGTPTYSGFYSIEDTPLFFNSSNLLQGFTDPNNDSLTINPSSLSSQYGNITPYSTEFGIIHGNIVITVVNSFGQPPTLPVIKFTNAINTGPIQFINDKSPTDSFKSTGIYLLGFIADNTNSADITCEANTTQVAKVVFKNFNTGTFPMITDSFSTVFYSMLPLNISQYFGTKLNGTIIRNKQPYEIQFFRSTTTRLSFLIYPELISPINASTGINIPISAGSYIYISKTSSPASLVFNNRVDIGTGYGNAAVGSQNIENSILCYPFQVQSNSNVYINAHISQEDALRAPQNIIVKANCIYDLIKLSITSKYGVFHRVNSPVSTSITDIEFQTTNYGNIATNSIFISPTSNNVIDIPEDGLYIISFYMYNWNKNKIRINMNINRNRSIGMSVITNQVGNFTTIAYLNNGDKFSMSALLETNLATTPGSIFDKLVIMKISE